MQQLIKGVGSLKTAAEIITKAGQRSVFLVTGKHFLLQHDLVFLKGINIHHFIKEGSNVQEAETALASKSFQESGAGVILAIGGGSVIDLAKAIIYKAVELSLPVPLFIAAPTTAGSGSEATAFAVVYRDKKKQSLVQEALLPQIVILDPSLTYLLPAYQTAVSGMDVFAQAVESFWNRNATIESREYATKSILLWKDNFLKSVNGNDNSEARTLMLDAAYLAGKAINITRTTGPHALSYYLTAEFSVAHGQAVSLFLPAFFLYNPPNDELYALLGVEDATQAADWLRHIMKEAGLATSLKELNIRKEHVVDELLSEVNEERFANNPSSFDRQRLKNLLMRHI